MTQQLPPAAAATAPLDADATVGATEPAPTTLAAQIDAAMAKLLGVSAKWKDLSGQDRQVSTREETIAMMQHYMDRLGMTQRVRAQLSVVHVAGTKGKGSTCAMTERILRQAGYKTGLFTSPHLISPCERVRINGKPIAQGKFLRHFDAVWNGLEATAHASGAYPPMAWFFRFLTLLALHAFLEEQVDVVILEVGIGGRLDATNVIEAPVVCGITTLDLDHVRVLGDTLDQIAHAKAGIFKRGVPAFTTAQEPLAMATLRECARETDTPLFLAPVLDDVAHPDNARYELGMQGDYQRVNAGLAASLANAWLLHKRAQPFAPLDVAQPLEDAVRDGLKLAFWPARSHRMPDAAHHADYYIDGAHTLRSLEVCAEWFAQKALTPRPATQKTALVFTIHYERNVAGILVPLLALPFDRVYFCATGASRPSLAKMNTFSEALRAAGREDVLAAYSTEQLAQVDAVPEGKLQWQHTLARLWRALTAHEGHTYEEDAVAVLPSVVDCIADLRTRATPQQPWNVLATGSLYLAGEALDFLGWSE